MSTLQTLPGDDVRQIMWRFSDRFDIQMAVQSARSIARGLAARLVANGARNTHEWTEEKAQLLKAFDESGLTALFLEPEQGGFIAGPKNLALALVAFELSWVDGGSATCSLANNLALAPIHERGTQEQREEFMKRCTPPQPGEDRKIDRGAFALTEALPYVGVDTGVLSGKVRVAEWQDGQEPMLQVEKRGRFITNMAFATYVTAAVGSDDERIKGSCMVILEENDPGVFDRGAPTLKMVHQLSATNDPVLSLTVPASRIIGGYTVKDGVIVPNYSHGEIIGAVFHRTRITVGLMTSAKLISAVEPVIRYHRGRFRGGDASQPGTPRYDLGIQQKEDALLRLADLWAMGEAGCSFGFASARLADYFDPLEREKDALMEEMGATTGRKQFMALKKRMADAVEYVNLLAQSEDKRDATRFQELDSDTLVRFLAADAEAGILNPGCKLWNTGTGANAMREAVSLMGGYGITEDCPGFLGHKWMDAQLEATYEGPEAVQRRHLTVTMTNEVFLAIFRNWIAEMKAVAEANPDCGASSLASAMEIWLWSLEYLQATKHADGRPLYHGKRQGVTFPMADALCWLASARYFLLDVLELKEKGPMNPVLAEGIEGLVSFYTDMSHAQAARSAAEAAKVCSALVYGYAEGQSLPGDLDKFDELRRSVDRCQAGSWTARERAGKALTSVMIPEALDYPI